MTASPVQSSCAAQTVFRLPELQEPIIRFLDIDDLLQCVLVSRAWNQIFDRQLWSSCDDLASPWKRIIRCACDTFGPKSYSCTDDRKQEARSLFSKFSPLVRHLSAKRTYMVHLFLDLRRGRLISNGDGSDKSDSLPRLESISFSTERYSGIKSADTLFAARRTIPGRRRRRGAGRIHSRSCPGTPLPPETTKTV